MGQSSQISACRFSRPSSSDSVQAHHRHCSVGSQSSTSSSLSFSFMQTGVSCTQQTKNSSPLFSLLSPLCSMKLCSKVRLLCSAHEACAAERKRARESACVCKSRGGVVSASLSSYCASAKILPSLSEREQGRET